MANLKQNKLSKKAKVICIDSYKREIEQLRKQDGDCLKPKTSRKITQINKRIRSIA